MKSTNKPVIILVNPQMGENIGAAARAMLNFGIDDLRIVNPRDGWPNHKAEEMSAGAIDVINNAQIFEKLEDAVKDIEFLYATTIRKRDMVKPVISSAELSNNIKHNIKIGFIFGGEKSGLSNKDITIADNILTIPVGKEYTSLNLAQSVAIICYEWLKTIDNKNHDFGVDRDLAKKESVMLFLDHLLSELEESNFFKVDEKKAKMTDNIVNIFTRIGLTEQEVRILRGVIRGLGEST